MKKVVLPLLFIVPFAVAQPPIRVNEVAKQQQQLQQIQRDVQARWLSEHQYQSTEESGEIADLSELCLPFDALEIVGVQLIDVQPLLPAKGECLNEARLNKLSKAITAAYLAKGYIHNPFQFENDGSGVLRLRINEGKVRELKSDSKRLSLAMLFPNLVGRPLNVKVLDQGLDQANRMSNVNASVDVFPQENGEIDVVIANDDRSPLSGFVTLDNRNMKRYGDWQARLGLNVDNALGLSDSLYLSANSTLKEMDTNFSRAFTLFHRIPYGNWSFSTLAAVSRSKADILLPNSTAVQESKNWQASFNINYTFWRGQNFISNFSAQLERISNRSEFNGSRLELQSPQLTTAQLQWSHLQLFNQGSLAFEVSYERGLSHWNRNTSDQPQGRFNKWNSRIQWQHYHQWATQLFLFNHELVGQYSRNYLPAVKQSELLGDYAVTGFKEFSLSAEKQLLWKNQLSWLKSYGNWKMEPYLAFDLGVQKNSTGNEPSVKAVGYGVGLKLGYKNLQTELGWGQGRVISATNFKPKEQNWRLSLNFLF